MIRESSLTRLCDPLEKVSVLMNPENLKMVIPHGILVSLLNLCIWQQQRAALTLTGLKEN